MWEITDEQRDDDRRHTRSSIIGGSIRREAVLARGCAEHDADPGTPCWRSDRSTVEGFCRSRWDLAVPQTQRVVGDGMTR